MIRKILLTLIVLFMMSGFDYQDSEVVIKEAYAISGYAVLEVKWNEGKCDIAVKDDIWLYECSGDEIIQRLPKQINDGYWIFIMHKENTTCAFAFNPDVEECRLYCECGIFQ